MPLILVHKDGGTLFAVLAFMTAEAPAGNGTEGAAETAGTAPAGHPCAGTSLRVNSETDDVEVLREVLVEVLTPVGAIMGPEHVEVYDSETTAVGAEPWNDLVFQVILKASDR